jgi:TPR repeat protein
MRTRLVTLAMVLMLFTAVGSSQMQDAETEIKAGQYATALAKIRPAAGAGDPVAEYLFASLYLNGNGVPKDTDEGLKWLTKSADQGYARAQSDLGAFYISGRHVAPDTKRGLELLGKAAAQGDPSASYNLGVMYRDGLGVAENRQKAESYFLSAAKKGHSDAQYGLARIAYDRKDFAQAVEWYGKAAQQGDLQATYNLAYMYHEGLGVDKSYQKANDLFLQVADKGRFEEDGSLQYKALDMLGSSYRDGLGVSQNYVEAYKWYFLAAVRGHPDGPAQMQAVARFLSESQISEARAAAKAFAERGKAPR